MSDKFKILSSYGEVSAFLPDVIAAADSEKNALGFFPHSVFHDYARREQLYVIVGIANNSQEYAGHLMFDSRFPKTKVIQMYCAPNYRGQGAAKILINYLKAELTRSGYISIYARVAEDLKTANSFWESQQFYVQQIISGGKSTKRIILVRAHELDAPQLFDSNGASHDNPFGLNIAYNADTPLFLIDLNVIFDLRPRRDRNKEVLDLFSAERQRSCQLAISNELEKELKRTALVGRTDPIQDWVRIFPNFALKDSIETELLINELAAIVFSHKKTPAELSKNDISDLRHLATVIQHGLTGLITNDEAILKSSATLKKKYNVYIFSPTAFKESSHNESISEVIETGSSEDLFITRISNDDESEVHNLLKKNGISASSINSDWAVTNGKNVAVRLIVRVSDKLIGYLIYSVHIIERNLISAKIAIDESNPLARRASQALIKSMLEQFSRNGICAIKLDFPLHQAVVREAASSFGFNGTTETSSLLKIILGGVITNSNWTKVCERLAEVSSVSLPKTPPSYKGIDQYLPITSNKNGIHLSIEKIESLLAPALICLSGRRALITPIRRAYAEQLLESSSQKTLLPSLQVALHHDKHYLSSPKNIGLFEKGTIILFYESLTGKGQGAIIALARVKRAYLRPNDVMSAEDFNPSVLDVKGLEKIGSSAMKAVTVFDNIIHLKRPVRLEVLQKIGCGRPNDLITTKLISDTQFQSILAEGFPNEQ